MSGPRIKQLRRRSVDLPDSERQVPTQAISLALRADWQRVLRDITSCGVVYLQLGNGVASLKSLAEPWAANVSGSLARLDGPGLKVAGNTDHWASVRLSRTCPARPFEHLDISDHFGNRLLRISLTEDSAWSRFHTLLARQSGRRSTPVVVPDDLQSMDRQSDLQTFANLNVPGPLRHDSLGVSSQKSTDTPIDASLLPPFLETLSEQVCPVGIAVCNRGLAQYLETALWDVDLQASHFRLRNSVAEFGLDLSGTATAYVVEVERTAAPQWLRLHDEQGNRVAILRLASQANAHDLDLWTTLLRALPV